MKLEENIEIIEWRQRCVKFHSNVSAVEKLIQAKTDSPVLTSFDPVHSPTAKEEEQGNLFSSIASPSNNNYAGSGHNSATSTPSSSTKRGSRRRTMLFSVSYYIIDVL